MQLKDMIHTPLVGVDGVILPKNEFPYAHRESTQQASEDIVYHRSDNIAFLSHRFVYSEESNNTERAISGIQIVEHVESGRCEISNVYTVRNRRRRGYATNLLDFAKKFLGKEKIYHSESLTDDGMHFAKSTGE